MYSKNSSAWLQTLNYERDSSTEGRLINRGAQQGDPLGGLLFMASISQLIRRLKTTQESVVKFYLDDGTYMAPFNSMQEILNTLRSEETFAKHGVSLADKKTRIIMAERADTRDAIKDRQSYASKNNIPIENIILHHANIQVTRGESGRGNYGLEILGTHVGSIEYVSKKLIQQGAYH